MIDKRKLLLILVGMMQFTLASCAAPTDRPWISSVQGEPPIAKERGPVVYTIEYGNLNEELSFADTVVVVTYDEYLDFAQNAFPPPDEISEPKRELLWKVGTLEPASSGSIQIEFRLAAKIPLEVYELKISAEISATDAEGDRTRYSRSETTMIEGHPTPTPTPTNTPLPTTPAPLTTLTPP